MEKPQRNARVAGVAARRSIPTSGLSLASSYEFAGLPSLPSPNLRPLPSVTRADRSQRLPDPNKKPLPSQPNKADTANGAGPLLRSLVVDHEIQLLELAAKTQETGSVTAEHAEKCFQAFDEIIPTAGANQRVLKLLRDEIFDLVYSGDLTASSNDVSRQDEIKQQPYFDVLSKLRRQRNDKADRAAEKTQAAKATIKQLQDTIAEKDERICALERDLRAGQDEVVEIRKQRIEEKAEVAKVKENCKATVQEAEQTVQQLESKVERLQDEIKALQSRIDQLLPHKRAYDLLAKKHRDMATFPDKTKKRANLTPRATLTHNLAEAKKSQEQLFLLQQRTISAFDTFLYYNPQEIPVEQPQLEQGEETDEQKEEEVEGSVKEPSEYDRIASRFQSDIELIWKELRMNDRHIDSLQSELRLLSNRDPIAYDTRDKFNPQEHILNKYSVAIYYAGEDGVAKPLPSTTFCPRCISVTTVCSHKNMKDNETIPLPRNATFLAFKRPQIQQASQDQSKNARGSTEEAPQDKTPDAIEIEQMNQLLSLQYTETAKESADLPRRVVPPNLLVSLIQEAVTYFIASDEVKRETRERTPIHATWFTFLTKRYLLDSTAVMASKDVSTAVANDSTASIPVTLFRKTLALSVSCACIRTAKLYAHFASLITWGQSIPQFRRFAAILFPFATDEQLDLYTLEFESFSEAQPSEETVTLYMTSCLYKEMDLGYLTMVERLTKYMMGVNVVSRGDLMSICTSQQLKGAKHTSQLTRIALRIFDQDLAGVNANRAKEDWEETLDITRCSQLLAYCYLLTRAEDTELMLIAPKSEQT